MYIPVSSTALGSARIPVPAISPAINTEAPGMVSPRGFWCIWTVAYEKVVSTSSNALFSLGSYTHMAKRKCTIITTGVLLCLIAREKIIRQMSFGKLKAWNNKSLYYTSAQLTASDVSVNKFTYHFKTILFL